MAGHWHAFPLIPTRVRGSRQDVRDVDQEVGDQDPDDHEQEDALEQGVVLVLDRSQQELADARVRNTISVTIAPATMTPRAAPVP